MSFSKQQVQAAKMELNREAVLSAYPTAHADQVPLAGMRLAIYTAGGMRVSAICASEAAAWRSAVARLESKP